MLFSHTTAPWRAPSHPRRPRALALTILGALALTITAAACAPANPPFWQPGTAVVADTPIGPLVPIHWSATNGGDAAQTYQVDINGVAVALLPAATRACILTGLNPTTTYTVRITAHANGHHSLEKGGTAGDRTTTVTTPAAGGAGTVKGCLPFADTNTDGIPDDDDADRLPDAVETNTGTYLSASNTGTDPTLVDTDNDGLTDGDEVFGRTGLNLNAMGARPVHKDLFVETDWLDDPACPTTGHRPTPGGLTPMIDAFANAQVANPDGTTGIRAIVDYGQGGLYTGGNVIADTDGRIANNSAGSTEFTTHKATHFNPARKGVFHYAILTAYRGGNAEFGGDDLVIGNGCNDNDNIEFARVLMHELGHNFLLNHGGWTMPNNPFLSTPDEKPNYNSIMNNLYARTGPDTNCDGIGDGGIGYSYGTNADLDETDLSETNGICNGVDIDWNASGHISNNVQEDINGDGNINYPPYIGGPMLPLDDYDDWNRIETAGLRSFRNNAD
ncbi:MAG TPA: hypothetical protein VEW93_06865 [Acidimicrobiales bacterium]|nr:hypothetical protein [Acidimicrobiales bacterium]